MCSSVESQHPNISSSTVHWYSSQIVTCRSMNGFSLSSAPPRTAGFCARANGARLPARSRSSSAHPRRSHCVQLAVVMRARRCAARARRGQWLEMYAGDREIALQPLEFVLHLRVLRHHILVDANHFTHKFRFANRTFTILVVLLTTTLLDIRVLNLPVFFCTSVNIWWK